MIFRGFQTQEITLEQQGTGSFMVIQCHPLLGVMNNLMLNMYGLKTKKCLS